MWRTRHTAGIGAAALIITSRQNRARFGLYCEFRSAQSRDKCAARLRAADERQFPDLRYWNEPAKGGHFAAFEQPAAFVAEVRAAFRSFR
jgi:hypothetical protein